MHFAQRHTVRCEPYAHECHVLALLNSGPLTSAGGSSRFTWIRIADLVPMRLNTVHKVVRTHLNACAHGKHGDGLLTCIRKLGPFSPVFKLCNSVKFKVHFKLAAI